MFEKRSELRARYRAQMDRRAEERGMKRGLKQAREQARAEAFKQAFKQGQELGLKQFREEARARREEAWARFGVEVNGVRMLSFTPEVQRFLDGKKARQGVAGRLLTFLVGLLEGVRRMFEKASELRARYRAQMDRRAEERGREQARARQAEALARFGVEVNGVRMLPFTPEVQRFLDGKRARQGVAGRLLPFLVGLFKGVRRMFEKASELRARYRAQMDRRAEERGREQARARQAEALARFGVEVNGVRMLPFTPEVQRFLDGEDC